MRLFREHSRALTCENLCRCRVAFGGLIALQECYLSVFNAFDVCLRSCAKVAWAEARELRDKNHRRQALLAYDLASTALNYSLGSVGQHRDGGLGGAVNVEEGGGGGGGAEGGHDDRLVLMDVREQLTLVTAERLRLMEELYGRGSVDLALPIAALKIQVAEQLRICGDGSQAVKLVQGSVDLHRIAVGKQHPLVASSLHQLALTLLRLDRLEEAAKVFEECLAMFREVSLGLQEEEASVATACNNLGIVYNRLGQLRRAVELHNEALDIRLRVRGQQHLETAQSICNLASVYANTVDRKSAQPLFHRAAAMYTELLGPTHPDAQDAANKAAKCEKK